MSTESIAGGLWFFIVKGGPRMIPMERTEEFVDLVVQNNVKEPVRHAL